MKPSLLLLLSFGITVVLKAQQVITLVPATGEVRKYSDGDLKKHLDLSVDGIRMFVSDSGQVMSEFNMKGGMLMDIERFIRMESW